MPALPADILTFWRLAGPAKWFAKDDRFDDAIRLKFEPVHHQAARGAYKVMRVLPVENDARISYRIKSAAETFERIAEEHQLSRN